MNGTNVTSILVATQNNITSTNDLANSITLSNIFALAGIILYLLICFSPAPIFVNAVKKKELIHNYTLFSLIFNAANAGILFCYGIKTADIFLYLTFLVGYIVYLAYVNAILYVEDEATSMLKYSGGLIGGILVVWIIFPALLVGIFLIAFNLGFCYTQMNKIKDDLKNKKSETLTMFVVATNFGCNLAWFLYGISIKSFLLIVAFLILLVFWLIDLVIFYWIQGSIKDDNFLIVSMKKYLVGEEISHSDNDIRERPNANLKLLTENDFQ